jgi:hypothetical protein
MTSTEESRPTWKRLASAIIVCNPLLLLSPMCLLYGIYRAVTAPNLFAEDAANTIFNFIALALYVLMVCVTSTLLARKRIIPDATMLLLLHALLFVAPFILIAHGVFLEGDLAAALGWGGMGCGLAQLWLLRHRLPETFFSRRFVVGGVLILAANFAAPMLFRHGLDNARNDNEVWGIVSNYAWNLALPLLAAWLNVLPIKRGTMLWSQSWFSFATYGLWLAGTAIQLWTVAYVDDRALRAYQFTAVLWVIGWTLFYRASIFPAPFAKAFQRFAPISVLFLPALGASDGLNVNIACVLFVLNVPLSMLAFGRMPVWAVSGLSIAGAVCCLPVEWLHGFVPQADRLQLISVTLAGLAFGGLAVLRDSRAGVIGAIAITISLRQFADVTNATALNMGILFFFAHQLRWGYIGRAESVLLFMAGVIWMIQTFALEARGENPRVACMVATVVATLALRNASLGFATSLVPPVCSIIVLLIHPTHVLGVGIAKAPSGVLAILFGFLLLGGGAWHSLRRAPVRIHP